MLSDTNPSVFDDCPQPEAFVRNPRSARPILSRPTGDGGIDERLFFICNEWVRVENSCHYGGVLVGIGWLFL
jgi:hypothetical protein